MNEDRPVLLATEL